LEDEVLAGKYNEVSMQYNQSQFGQQEQMESQLEALDYQNRRLMATV